MNNDDITKRQIKVTATLNASTHKVWDVWTTPKHIASWWGPNGFTNTIHQMDVTAGGEWRLTMQGPDGKNYPNRSTFIEIVPEKKITFQHYNPNYRATVVFEPKRNVTMMEWIMEFETAELFDTVVKVFKADEGLKQNVEKLKRYLETVKTELNFFIASMPESRHADYYLGCHEGSVFIDFDNHSNDRVCLRRISFDGYGCRELNDPAKPMSEHDSRIFKAIVSNPVLDQASLTVLIQKTLSENRHHLWEDALAEYHLI